MTLHLWGRQRSLSNPGGHSGRTALSSSRISSRPSLAWALTSRSGRASMWTTPSEPWRLATFCSYTFVFPSPVLCLDVNDPTPHSPCNAHICLAVKHIVLPSQGDALGGQQLACAFGMSLHSMVLTGSSDFSLSSASPVQSVPNRLLLSSSCQHKRPHARCSLTTPLTMSRWT